MVDALHAVLQARDPAHPVERIETHISFVLVGREFAYKLKKAVNPGFLDFTTLALRRHCCAEEVRLNRRLAPDLYLDVVPVTGSVDAPDFSNAGPVIDYAVRMRAFEQQGLWDRLARRGELTAAHIDALNDQLDRFHQLAPSTGAESPFGTPRQVREPMLDNLRVLAQLVSGEAQRDAVAALGRWEAAEFAAIEPLLEERRLQGHVRECHGDLHLRNVVQIDGRCTVFDCLEFNESLRWIDVISEVAFMAMDLMSHGCTALAHRFVNGCLERSGDYTGARVLRWYVVYRALVRAKVAALRAAQAGAPAAEPDAGVRHFLDLALAFARQGRPALMITHGFSGSGKTTGTQALLEAIGAIRVRADIERKRLFGLDATARSASALHRGLYTASATEATYTRLREAALPALAGGSTVLLDATFAKRRQRDAARELAAQQQLPFFILDFAVERETLRERVRARAARGGDASEADLPVLEAQLRSAEALDDDERRCALACPAHDAPDASEIERRWRAFACELQLRLAAGRELAALAGDCL